MSSPMKCLVDDDERYLRSFQLFLERSSEHQCMQDFIHGTLPDILASVGDGKAKLNVIGVGSGGGEIDLEMFSQLRLKHPSITVDNHVVEPSSQQMHNYKVLVAKTRNLDYINFNWNKMLYYVKDPDATVSFFQSLLHVTGKLLIILVSGTCVTTADIKTALDARGVGYRSYVLPSQMDISECFVEGSEEGGLLLDFLTEVLDFSRTAPAELRAGVLELLRHPDCSVETQGRVVFNNNLEALASTRMSTTETSEAGYGGNYLQRFKEYLEVSGEHAAVCGCVSKLMLEEFKRIGSGKSHLEVLGLGSGGGEVDIHILKTLQSILPSVHMSVEAVEPSADLIKNFKDLVANTSSLQNVPFEWHMLTSAEYEKKVNTNKDIKKFDLIHMIQMLYYVDDHAATIKFFHSLKELCTNSIAEYSSAGDIKAHIDSLGLKYDEFATSHAYDITDCFDPESGGGERLLDFMTDQERFHRSLTPELRKGILDLLRNKCSTEKDGRVMFNSNLTCILGGGDMTSGEPAASSRSQQEEEEEEEEEKKRKEEEEVRCMMEGYDFYLKHSGEHEAIRKFIDTLTKVFESLLKEHGTLLIVHEAADSGWALLWKAYKKALWSESTSDYLSAGDIKAHLDRSGLRYDEVTAANSFDITDCFDLDSPLGERLLDSMTAQEHFHRSLTPELRKGILDLLRNKCSTEKDGRVMFNSNLSCMLLRNLCLY
ncbi:hypothetical protein CRUP_011414 [Coryphaenoides rupestris]|nr:hypothetical protein CRUP_011414 [Coryphaenoides rupestris]